MHVLSELVDSKKKYKSKKKPTTHEVEEVRKNAVQLTNNLIEFGQRCELAELQKNKVTISYKDKKADLFLTTPAFLVAEGKIQKLTDKIQDANQEEFEKTIREQKGKPGKLTQELLALLKKEIGDFEIVL